jgi:3-isopropylmalate/(R)-2-methylmalate dehydratase small subunit
MEECVCWKQISGRGISLRGDDIDTDRIIPARYLKCITFEGIGQYAFYDERFDEKGRPKAHPLNDEVYRGANILIVNRNFGCGSSREHAPQSLLGFGIRAFIGESFAEIFAGNCTALGMPAVTLDGGSIAKIMDMVEASPRTIIDMDLEEKSVTVGGKRFDLEMPETYRMALISGSWDSTLTLLGNREDIVKLEESLPYGFVESH